MHTFFLIKQFKFLHATLYLSHTPKRSHSHHSLVWISRASHFETRLVRLQQLCFSWATFQVSVSFFTLFYVFINSHNISLTAQTCALIAPPHACAARSPKSLVLVEAWWWRAAWMPCWARLASRALIIVCDAKWVVFIVLVCRMDGCSWWWRRFE